MSSDDMDSAGEDMDEQEEMDTLDEMVTDTEGGSEKGTFAGCLSSAVGLLGGIGVGAIGGAIAQSIAGEKGFAWGSGIGFVVGFCVTVAIFGKIRRR